VATSSSPSRRTLWTKTEVTISMPSSSSAAASVAEASASASGAIRSAASTIVTLEPKREHAWPNSSPTAPAPTTSSDSGNSASSSAEMWSIQSTSPIPSIGGTAVREPVAIRIRSAWSSRPAARTVFASASSASAVIVVKPCASSSSIHCGCGFFSDSFHARTRARSTFAGLVSTPIRAASSFTSCANSAATR